MRCAQALSTLRAGWGSERPQRNVRPRGCSRPDAPRPSPGPSRRGPAATPPTPSSNLRIPGAGGVRRQPPRLVRSTGRCECAVCLATRPNVSSENRSTPFADRTASTTARGRPSGSSAALIRTLVSATTRSAFIHQKRVEPSLGQAVRRVLNETYADLLDHYGAQGFPACVRRPRDKGLVEQGVLHAERWVLAPLRNSHLP